MNRVYVVGIGPGAGKQMTEEAREVLNACDTIIGYTAVSYTHLVYPCFGRFSWKRNPGRGGVPAVLCTDRNRRGNHRFLHGSSRRAEEVAE